MIRRAVALLLCVAFAVPVQAQLFRRWSSSGAGVSYHCGNGSCSMCNRNFPPAVQRKPAPKPTPPLPEIASTPMPVVDAMLAALGLDETDTVYDLGCGDGRFCQRAVEQYGCRAVGIENDKDVAALARRLQTSKRVLIVDADATRIGLDKATAVVVYQDMQFLALMSRRMQGVGRVASYCHPIPGMRNREGIVMIDDEPHRFYIATPKYEATDGGWLAI